MHDIVTQLQKKKSFELDINQTMTEITLQIMGLAGFGVDLGVMNGKASFDASRHSMSLQEALTITSGDAIVTRMRFPSWAFKLPLHMFKRINEAIENTDKYIDDIITARTSETDQKYDLLSLLVAARDEDNGQGFTRMEVKR
jgi:cytochrome P450